MPVSKSLMAVSLVIIAVVAFVAGLFSAPYVFPPAEEEDPVWARVLETGKIVVGSSPDWPPYEFYDEQGNWAGFEVELMEMVAERLNLTVEWREMGFETIIPEVRDMTIDLGVSGFSVTPERLDVVQFTMPHSITEGQIIMLESRRNELGITEIHSIEELADLGIQVGVQVGTTQHDELAEKAPDCVVVFDDYVLALQAMKDGSIDAVYAETPVTSWWILQAEQAGEEPIVVIYRRSYYPVAWVANKEADTLVAKINGALAGLFADGKVDELKAKWRC